MQKLKEDENNVIAGKFRHSDTLLLSANGEYLHKNENNQEQVG